MYRGKNGVRICALVQIVMYRCQCWHCAVSALCSGTVAAALCTSTAPRDRASVYRQGQHGC